MLVQALAQYTRTYLQNQLDDIAFEEKPVQYGLIIDKKGKFIGIQNRQKEDGKGFESMLVPKSPVARNSGIHPLLCCDSVEYVLGSNPDVWAATKAEEKSQRFLDIIEEAYKATNSEALRACGNFLNSESEKANAVERFCEEKLAGSILVCLFVQEDNLSPPKSVHLLKDVKDHWTNHFNEKTESSQDGGEGICLISGEFAPLARTHPKIKGTASLGGQAAGVSLMSFDKTSFKSYNWDQNANSPVSIKEASAYVMALNNLLVRGFHTQGGQSRRTRSDFGSTAFLYWTKEPVSDNLFASIEDPKPEEISKLLSSVHTGNEKSLRTSEDNMFYLLSVSANGGRLVVKDFFTESLSNIKKNLANWFENLSIADPYNGGEPSEAPKLRSICWHASPPAERSKDKYSSMLTTQLVRRALYGNPVGLSLLAKILGRLRSEPEKRMNPVVLGTIRLIVNDNLKEGDPKMTESLDHSQKHPAYVCGRLLAVYENLQFQASKDVGVTVAERYFSMASTFPRLAFPNLERLSKAHLKKLRRDNRPAFYAIQGRISELMEIFNDHGAVWPGNLGLTDQGRFAIGYHHQKAEDSRKAKAAKETKISIED